MNMQSRHPVVWQKSGRPLAVGLGVLALATGSAGATLTVSTVTAAR